jgi:hypothetical protein
MKIWNLLFGSAAILLSLSVGAAAAETVLTSEEASNTLKIEQVNAAPDTISGKIVNASPHVVRDVVLLVQYHWLWNNERHPGQNPPGRMITVPLNKEIAPGESLPFNYSPTPPLPHRDDGHFMPEVAIGGFSVVVPQSSSRG